LELKTIILAGGLGTRLSEETVSKPKPMVEIGNIPIIEHLVGIYSRQGFTDFNLALGYKKELLEEWASKIVKSKPINIVCTDTGEDTQTGGRVKRVMGELKNQQVFVTYGDGLANIDLRKLLSFHKSHGKLATVTAVRPPARFGHLNIVGDQVIHFGEKNQSDEGWINGGFFVFNQEVIDFIESDSEALENGALPKLAQIGELMAFHHFGFWKPMDALRDKYELEELAKLSPPPWLESLR
jgi:glucose-1-phosphate cytidylyltransferase